MIPDASLLLSHPNLAVGVLLSAGTFLAEAVAAEPGWENLTLKGLLLAAVLYLVRELAKQRDLDKTEAKLREDKLTRIVEGNTSAMQDLKSEVSQQTKYFQDVARVIIDGRVGEQPVHRKP